MSSSLNAVSNFASVRDTPQVTSASVRNQRSGGNPDSFRQVFHQTANDQRSSGTNGSREPERKDKKSAKKDSDTNPATAVSTDSNTVSEKSSLPITFLFGLANEQLPTFDAQHDNTSPDSAIDAKGLGASKLKQLGLLGQPAGRAGDVNVLAMQVPEMLKVDSSQKADASTANSESPAVIPLGESGTSVKGVAGTPSNTLAFAMRLGSGAQAAVSTEKANNSSQLESPRVSESTPTNFAAATHPVVEAASGSTLEEHAHEHGESDQAQNTVDLSAAQTAKPFDATKIAEENTAPSAAQMPADPSASATNEPVKNVHMQLVSDDNRRVDVRLIDRGGELHVSVKSADPALTQSLQDHLPDLTARLDKQHMQTEVWVPKAAEPSKAESGNTNGSLSDSKDRSYSGNSEGRKDGQQQRKPDWVDALENYS